MTEDQIRKDEREKTIAEIKMAVEQISHLPVQLDFSKMNSTNSLITNYNNGVNYGLEKVLNVLNDMTNSIQIECEEPIIDESQNNLELE